MSPDPRPPPHPFSHPDPSSACLGPPQEEDPCPKGLEAHLGASLLHPCPHQAPALTHPSAHRRPCPQESTPATPPLESPDVSPNLHKTALERDPREQAHSSG